MQPETINGGIAVDDRGSVRFVNDFDFTDVKRFYQVENHRVGFIRAWHGHYKEAKYVYIPRGAALIGAVSLEYYQQLDMPGIGTVPGDLYNKPFKVVLSDKKPQVLYIPAGYANGFKTLEPNTIIQFFSTSTLEDTLNDDIRYDYNNPNIWDEEFR